MQAAPPDIPDLHFRGPGQFALNRDVPVPGRGELEIKVLHGDGEREVTLGGPTRRVNQAVDDRLLRLERGVAASRRSAVDNVAFRDIPTPGGDTGILIRR